MKVCYHYRVFLFFILLGNYSLLNSQSADPFNQWKEESLSSGIVWKHLHTDQMFNGFQNLNALFLDPQKIALKLLFEQNSLRKTSSFGQEYGAIAAVNGGFFNVERGGSVTFLKVGGVEIVSMKDQSTGNQEIRSAAFYIHKGIPGITHARDSLWHFHLHETSDVLVTGPLLLYHNERYPLASSPFNNNRHPRTGICITEDEKIILLTADGRNSKAYGLTLGELTEIFESLGCRDAINLDGGGSTTLWLLPYGVVNKPSDNRLFDHEGERPVANVLAIFTID